MPFDGRTEVAKRYGAVLTLLIVGVAVALSVFVLLPHGEQKYAWQMPSWLSPWLEIVGWAAIAAAIYGFLKLRLILLTPPREGRRK